MKTASKNKEKCNEKKNKSKIKFCMSLAHPGILRER